MIYVATRKDYLYQVGSSGDTMDTTRLLLRLSVFLIVVRVVLLQCPVSPVALLLLLGDEEISFFA